ncbi:MAG: carboxymuconolactone decarboxylase family protein [Thermoplasmata archaeon]|nr:carboxymuconolactone decarboxylase family protein [Thermoplasmata archaeon]
MPSRGFGGMQENPEQRAIVDKMLETIRREYGFVPVVNQVLSERPDVFVPMGNLGKAVLEADGDIDRKHRYLCAIAAASALGGEYCLDVQTKHAKAAGATKDEIFEAMMIGAYMAMTRSESYAFRKLASNFDMELE